MVTHNRIVGWPREFDSGSFIDRTCIVLKKPAKLKILKGLPPA